MPYTRRNLLLGTAMAQLAAAQPLRLPKKIKVGFIWLVGHTAEVVRPLPQLPDVEVTAIFDPSPQVRAQFVKRPPFEKVRQYTDYREMLAKEEFDIVAVCNSNGERAEAVRACVEKKVHVIAEKPLAIERDDFNRTWKAIVASDRKFSMLLPMRFDPEYLALHRAVENGDVGEVAQISSQKSYQAGSRAEWMRNRKTYGGTIPWIGIHMVDLMRWASGREFIEAMSFQGHIGFPDIGAMENTTASVFRLDNGGVATLHMDYLRPAPAGSHGDDRLRLAGTKGIVEYQGATGVTLSTEKKAPHQLKDLPPARHLFVEFLESIYHGKAEPVTMQEILRANEITLAAQEAAVERRVVPA